MAKKKNMAKKKIQTKPVVAVIMGSDSDLPTMKGACEALQELNVSFEVQIISAHRTPQEMASFAEGARARGIKVIIAGAGGAAHLPGMVAAHTELPVIGVPVPHGALQGQDALLSIVQMPKGVPVATVAIGNSYNAGMLAAQIVGTENSTSSQSVLSRVRAKKEAMRTMVVGKNKGLKIKI